MYLYTPTCILLVHWSDPQKLPLVVNCPYDIDVVQARNQGGGGGRGVHGVRSQPLTGLQGPHFDTRYPSLGVESVEWSLKLNRGI